MQMTAQEITALFFDYHIIKVTVTIVSFIKLIQQSSMRAFF